MLLSLSAAGALAATATIVVPRVPLPDRFGPNVLEHLWFDGFWQQWSGYLLLALSVASLVIAVIIRQRLVARITAGEARLPMRPDAAHRTSDCGTCHRLHPVDTAQAAAEACASCHDDSHSRAYFDSPHYRLWQAELAGEAPPGTGVSCATCHMPRTVRRGKVSTNHNQNDNLRPNEKMVRSVCLDCHGLGFSLDSLADADLVGRNFSGMPTVHVESIEWAMQRAMSGEQDPGG